MMRVGVAQSSAPNAKRFTQSLCLCSASK